LSEAFLSREEEAYGSNDRSVTKGGDQVRYMERNDPWETKAQGAAVGATAAAREHEGPRRPHRRAS